VVVLYRAQPLDNCAGFCSLITPRIAIHTKVLPFARDYKYFGSDTNVSKGLTAGTYVQSKIVEGMRVEN